jgi:outer membrane protein assembly factor BamE (lipoprotein component of BamABCDE complex)
MIIGKGRSAVLAAALLTAALPGCTRTVNYQGYVADEALITSVQPGVDTRDSVIGTLGRPSFVGEFDQRDWYYAGRTTQQFSFRMPHPTAQTVLHIRFDPAGNVASVQRTGLEQIASINPLNDKTPTLGRNRGFFRELFSNIGAVGTGGSATGTPSTTDNPH